MENVSKIFVEEDHQPMPAGARYVAVRLLSRFERSDSYIDKLLEHEHKNSDLNPYDKSLLTELVNGVTRWKSKLDWILTGFYRGDYQKCLNIVKNAMRVALYQIIFLSKIPIPSAIYESVEIVKRIQSEKTAGIVNGVLRNIVRNLENVRYPEQKEDLVYYFSVIYSHPKWMIKRWFEFFGPEETEKLLVANNHRPNLPIRINTTKTTVREVVNFLIEHDITFYKTSYMENSLRLKTAKPIVLNSELFSNGEITIQDTSASLAAKLAGPKPGSYILDLCAAPGGKSLYLAEQLKGEGKVLAVEKYPSRLHFIEENAKRLGFDNIESIAGDATEFNPERQVDVVFADVPCSGTGTISKRPDIKWKRDVDDIPKLAALQKEIMANAATIIQPGGVFVYSTCSIEPEENIKNVEWFVKKFPEFVLDPADNYLHSGVCKDGFMQTFPHIHYSDGAFAARFIKRV